MEQFKYPLITIRETQRILNIASTIGIVLLLTSLASPVSLLVPVSGCLISAGLIGTSILLNKKAKEQDKKINEYLLNSIDKGVLSLLDYMNLATNVFNDLEAYKKLRLNSTEEINKFKTDIGKIISNIDFNNNKIKNKNAKYNDKYYFLLTDIINQLISYKTKKEYANKFDSIYNTEKRKRFMDKYLQKGYSVGYIELIYIVDEIIENYTVSNIINI